MNDVLVCRAPVTGLARGIRHDKDAQDKKNGIGFNIPF